MPNEVDDIATKNNFIKSYFLTKECYSDHELTRFRKQRGDLFSSLEIIRFLAMITTYAFTFVFSSQHEELFLEEVGLWFADPKLDCKGVMTSQKLI